MKAHFRFREFRVYRDTLIFRKDLKKFSREHFPVEERFVLLPQLWRALDSIVLNIAEGSDKYSDIDFSRYLNQALTSLSEVVACLDSAYSDRYLSEKELNDFLEKAGHLRSQLLKFSSKVRNGKS